MPASEPLRVSRRQALAAAAALAVSATARAAADEADTVQVPAGPVTLGTPRAQAEALARRARWHVTWFEGEYPERRVLVAAFAIDRHPVTNARYLAFCRAAGHVPPVHWNGREPPAGLLNHPVVYVNRDDAEAFARWAGKRLPTEDEWEKAARGEEGRVYPWGRAFRRDACCWNRDLPGDRGGTEPVDAHPGGASPYGVMDMVGNAAEWTATLVGPGSAAVRGGCWMTQDPLNLRAAYRGMGGYSNNRLPYIGFRCVSEVR